MYNRNNVDDYDRSATIKFVAIGAISFIALTGFVGACSYIRPKYNIWAAEQEGMAQYAQAEQNRKIAVLEAKAKFEAALALAEAEVARANGVAHANEIIGASLKNNESYLRWLWIQNLESGSNSVIYIPTEAGLPILEAGKR
jgi:hypothetical protein